MKIFTFILVLIVLLIYQSTFSQIKYYTATGRDSITYVATDIGLLILNRDSNGVLNYHSLINDSNKVYTRALDNDNYLILSTSNTVDIYSLSNKYFPNYIGSLGNVSNIISIRPFGNHFAILRRGSNSDHYIVGVKNDSLKILSTINTNTYSYSGRTAFYPEAVYPYFFSKSTVSQIVMFKFNEANQEFELIDSINNITNGYSFVQMYGANNLLFIHESSGSFPNYSVYSKKFEIISDTLNLLSRTSYNAPFGFTDEIECTKVLIRFNGSYSYINGQTLNEPNGYLSAYPNLSGIRIYNTSSLYDKMYYSTTILGTTIQSAQFIYTPSSVGNTNPVNTYALYQNYPNPFNPSTTIRFSMPEESFVTIKVFNTLGEEITTLISENIIAGNYEIEFDASKLPSGIYFYKLQTETFIETKKMMLMK